MKNTTMHYTNATVYTPDEVISGGTVLVENGIIKAIYKAVETPSDTGYATVDLGGSKLVPGFIDVHVHGGGGYDAMSGRKTDIDGMSLFHAAQGTTAFLPTTLTAEHDQIEQSIRAIVSVMEEGTNGAEVIGIHLEGPFLNVERSGAQNPAFIRKPSVEELKRFLELGKGHVRLMTIAPEMEGAMELIQYAVSQNVTISIGHSDATFDIVKQAVAHGASHITHLFNGMRPLHHREPGVVGAALMLDDLTVEMICDGHHVAEELVRYVFHVKAAPKVVLITDAMSAAGLADGDDYDLGGLPCYLKDGQVRLKSTHDLAGSTLTTGQALRNAMRFTDGALEHVLPALTINPARQVGFDRRKGSIEVGKDADFVVLDAECEVQATIVGGRCVYGQLAART